MRHIELGMAALTITGAAWARIHHWRTGHRADRGGTDAADR